MNKNYRIKRFRIMRDKYLALMLRAREEGNKEVEDKMRLAAKRSEVQMDKLIGG